jgi:hypothetical protein
VTLAELETMVNEAAWFTRLGQFTAGPGYIAIRTLEMPEQDDDWDWLPTTMDQPDPIHATLADQVRDDEVIRRERLRLHKLALVSLRHAENPLLRVGSVDLTTAAKGAALFAVRMAVAEIMSNVEARWTVMVPLYAQGHWPCGLADDGCIVVL